MSADNGNYTITNPVNGSYLVMQITDAADASVAQYNAAGVRTGGRVTTRNDAINAVAKATKSGANVARINLTDCLSNVVTG